MLKNAKLRAGELRSKGMVTRGSGSTWRKRRKTRNENIEGDFLGQAPAGVPPGTVEKAGVAPGNQRGYQGGASGCGDWSADRGHAGSVEGVMDLMEFTDWLVQRVLFLGGLLLLVMAVSQIF